MRNLSNSEGFQVLNVARSGEFVQGLNSDLGVLDLRDLERKREILVLVFDF